MCSREFEHLFFNYGCNIKAPVIVNVIYMLHANLSFVSLRIVRLQISGYLVCTFALAIPSVSPGSVRPIYIVSFIYIVFHFYIFSFHDIGVFFFNFFNFF